MVLLDYITSYGCTGVQGIGTLHTNIGCLAHKLVRYRLMLSLNIAHIFSGISMKSISLLMMALRNYALEF